MKRIIIQEAEWAVMDVQGMSPEGPVTMKVVQVTEPVGGEVYELPLTAEQAQTVARLLTQTREEAEREREQANARSKIEVASALPDVLRNGPGR